MIKRKDPAPSLAAQLGSWARSDPGMEAVAGHIADAVKAHMPAGLTAEQEISFMSALIMNLMAELRRIMEREGARGESE